MLGSGSITRLRVQSTSCQLACEPGYVINFPITVSSSSGNLDFAIRTTSAGTVAMGRAMWINGSWTGTLRLGGASTTHFINLGTIEVTGSGATLAMAGARFTNALGGLITVGTSTTIVSEVTGTEEGSWANEGVINASGATITLQGAWANRRTIQATNSSITLRGTFTSDSAMGITRTGRTLSIEGVMDNRGRSILLDSATGSWDLSGGTILGGTLSWVDPQRLNITNNPRNLLDSVAFTRELVLNQFDGIFTIAGAAPMAGIRAANRGVPLQYADGAVINYPIVAEGAGQLWVRTAVNGGAFMIGPQGSITTGPGSQASIRVGYGSGSPIDPATGRLTNHGRIESSTPGNTLRVRAGLVQNSGTIRVGNGVQGEVLGLSGEVGAFDVGGVNSGLTLNGNYTLRGTTTVRAGGLLRLNGSWRNEGTVAVASGTLELGGTFPAIRHGSITNAGGNVTIVGTLNNNGTLRLDSTTGSWGVSGNIVGGSVVQSEGSRIVPIGSPAFLDVAIGGELLVANANARPRLEGTTRAGSYRVTGNASALLFAPGHVLREEVVFEGDAPDRSVELVLSNPTGTLTLAPGGRIRVLGGSVSIGARHVNWAGRSLNVQGVIEAVGLGSTAVINSPILANYDTASGRLSGGTWRGVQGGSISFNGRPIRVNAATIELDGEGATPADLVSLGSNEGTLRLSGGRDLEILTRETDADLFTNAGRLEIGAGSELRVGSDLNAAGFAQTAAGVTRFALGGTDAAQHGRISAVAAAALDGTAEVTLADGFALACGMGFDVLSAASVGGRFASLVVPTVADGSRLIAVYGETGVRLAASPEGDFNADGFVDAFDYLDFVGCFEGMCGPDQNADFNQDGFVDFFDFDGFSAAFERGC
jgi:hypothetical protein